MEKMLSPENKEKLIKAGIIAGSIIVILTVLILMIVFTKNSFLNGMRIECQEVLEEYESDAWKVGAPLKINSIQSTSCCVYKLDRTRNDNSDYYCVVLRIPSINGSQAGVFVYSKQKGAFFAGYVLSNGKAERLVKKEISESIIGNIEGNIRNLLLKGGIINEQQ